MKKLFAVFAMICMVALAAPAAAQEGSVNRPDGFGIGLGQGTVASGISLKKHTGPTALQGVVGCWGYACRAFGASVDILFNMPTFVDADVVQLAWNIGGGGAFGAGEGRYWRDRYDGYGGYFTVRGQFVAGLEFIFPDIPLDIVLEWRPSIRIIPSPRPFFFGGGAHIRIYL